MALNIKSDETHRLARELAALTGESMSTAVTIALQERLGRLRRERNEGMAARLLEIGREAAPLFKEPYRSVDHGDLLYDEKGLPA
ncbi:MAG TPA: type II toxin-antitoxin system VapB family antitoxin [Geminicoccaceae bacterium]|nr:type II toxin-antitoxin system VapB family antitoxin [Geminicoccus sp.]HMU49701.1 type II toxin-antitoxin system VapB family antitoxin [Geminicoccaceae bacterium]